MSSHLPRRFSVRTMLVLVAIVAFAIYAIGEHVRLRNARDRFWRVWSGWQAMAIGTEDVVSASEALMNAESASPWTSRRSAEGQHAVRLLKILAHVLHPASENAPGRTAGITQFYSSACQRFEFVLEKRS